MQADDDAKDGDDGRGDAGQRPAEPARRLGRIPGHRCGDRLGVQGVAAVARVAGQPFEQRRELRTASDATKHDGRAAAGARMNDERREAEQAIRLGLLNLADVAQQQLVDLGASHSHESEIGQDVAFARQQPKGGAAAPQQPLPGQGDIHGAAAPQRIAHPR